MVLTLKFLLPIFVYYFRRLAYTEKKFAIYCKAGIKHHKVSGFIPEMHMMLMFFGLLQCTWGFWLLKLLGINDFLY